MQQFTIALAQPRPGEEFASVAALHPPSRPAIPEGKSLPGSAGVDWKLACEDDFDRSRLGNDWGFQSREWAEGPFNFGGGVLTARNEMYSFMSYAHKVTLPLRVEYDVKATGGCVASVALTTANEVGLYGVWHASGYALTTSRGGHSINREGQRVAGSKGLPGTEPGKWHHVVAQFVRPKVMLLVDGKPAAEFEDPQWLPGLDTFSFVGDAWSAPQIDNVRVYAAGQ